MTMKIKKRKLHTAPRNVYVLHFAINKKLLTALVHEARSEELNLASTARMIMAGYLFKGLKYSKRDIINV